jgi:outer membrane protein
MTPKRPAWAVILLALLAAPGLRAGEKMTLQQAVDLVVQQSAAVQIAAESVTSAELKVKESRSLYLPQVNTSGSYTRLSLISKFTIPYQGQMQTFKFGTPNNYNFRLGATEQLFTWGRIKSTVEMSRVGTEMARQGVDLTRQALAYQVVPMFYSVVFTREAVKVLDESLALFGRKLATLESRYQAGLASDLDVSLIKVQMSALEGQKLDLLNNVHKTAIAFNRLAGRPLETDFDPAGELALTPVQADADALLKEAQANRLELRQTQNQKDLLGAQMSLARAAVRPTVAATFTYEFRNGFMPDIEKIRGNWNAVLALSYPIFDGHRSAAQVAQAEVALRTVEEQEADLERGFAMEIAQTLADLRTIEEKLAIETTKIGHAEKALRIAEERYANGLLSTNDLIEAQTTLETARLNRLQLVFSHILVRSNLDRAAGRRIYS